MASFGALAVTAIVVVFSAAQPQNAGHFVFATGLLAIAVFAGFLGSFGLAAVGAEEHPTANLSAAILFVAVTVVLGFVAMFGAFEVLAAVYINQATTLFTFITAAGGAVGVAFTSAAVGDSAAMHPTTMDDPVEFDRWRERQWIKNQTQAYREARRLSVTAILPVAVATVIKSVYRPVDIGVTGDSVVVAGIVLILVATFMSLNRVKHPTKGNDQRGVRPWEAWGTVSVISLYTTVLILVLPI